MSGTNGSPGRSTKVVLQETLDELHERERKLLPFIQEIDQVRKAIKTIERAMGRSTARPRSQSGAGAGDTKERIKELLAGALEPMTKEQLAEGLGHARGLHLVLAAMVKDGSIVEAEGGYGLPAPSLAAKA